MPAEPLREKPVSTPQAATPQLEDIGLATLADELHLEETPITRKPTSQGAVKKVFLNVATETPTHPNRILVSPDHEQTVRRLQRQP